MKMIVPFSTGQTSDVDCGVYTFILSNMTIEYVLSVDNSSTGSPMRNAITLHSKHKPLRILLKQYLSPSIMIREGGHGQQPVKQYY
jgi:hypothetical protein